MSFESNAYLRGVIFRNVDIYHSKVIADSPVNVGLAYISLLTCQFYVEVRKAYR